MSVKVDITNAIKALEAVASEQQISRIQNAAINKGSEIVSKNVISAFSKFKGSGRSTGATAEEVTLNKARKIQGIRQAQLKWSGPKDRYRLIHLNEWGYTKNGKRHNPRMMGTIQQTLDSSEKDYYEAIRKELVSGYGKIKY